MTPLGENPSGVSSPPSVVEVEIGTRCNLSCSYCPNSVRTLEKNRWITPYLFESILDQLAEMGFRGRFSFHLYNEPLLHKGLESLVSQVCLKLPAARPVLFTNGIGLSDARHRSLTDAGVAHFVVTRHRAAAAVPPRSNQTLLVPEQLRLTNRGGIMNPLSAPLTSPCYAPMEMLVVTSLGEVLLCFEDARKRRVMGNLHERRLAEIWFGEAFREARRSLVTGRRDQISDLCALCDNRDYPVPGLTEGITCKS